MKAFRLTIRAQSITASEKMKMIPPGYSQGFSVAG